MPNQGRQTRSGLINSRVGQLSILDIADHRRAFRAVRRVLTDSGVFMFSLLHPCFDGSPFHWPDEPKYLLDESGAPIACVVRRYANEGYLQSDGTGVRGRLGAYYRMLSTYINDLLMSGFRLERIEEPLIPEAGLFSELPLSLVVAAHVY